MKKMVKDLVAMYGWTESQAREYLYKIGYQYCPWVTDSEE